jgi:hypothetical protein
MSEINRVKIDSIIESQIPEFINDEYPLFVEFLKSYYKSQEHQSGVLDLTNNLPKYKNINYFTDINLNKETTLTSEILSFDSNIFVDSLDGLPKTYGLVKIDDEIITYTDSSNNSIRGSVTISVGSTIAYYQNIPEQYVGREFKFRTRINDLTGNKIKNPTIVSVASTYVVLSSPGVTSTSVFGYNSSNQYLFDINNPQLLNCIRGFSAIDSIKSIKDSKVLSFSSTEAEDHSNGSVVSNLSNLFLIQFFEKFKSEFFSGFEGREFNEGISVENVLLSARDFYSSKGTDQSYKFLFKILYGKDIEILKPQDYTLTPSANVYFTTKNVLVEKISGGDPTTIRGNFLYQNITGIGTVSASIYNIEYRPVNGKDFYELSLDSNSFSGTFQVSGKTKILNDVPSESSTILVDSTVGFNKSGVFLVKPENSNFIRVSYTDKTTNQFLGVTGVTKKLDFGLDVVEERFAYSYIGIGNTSKIEFRLVNVIDNVNTDETSNLVIGDKIKLTGFGKDLRNLNEFNSWIYNIPTAHNILKVDKLESTRFRVFIYDAVSFYLGETVVLEDINGKYFDGVIINIEYPSGDPLQKVSKQIIVQILDSTYDFNFSKKLRKKISKGIHALNYYPDINEIPSGVQNTYIDSKSKYFYLTSTGIPNFPIFSTDNQKPISTVSVGTTDTLICQTNNFSTGELIYYSPYTNDTSGITTGPYYATVVGNNEIKLSYSKSDIFSKKYILTSPVGVSSGIVIKSGYENKSLKNQKLLKKFPIDKEIFEFDDINKRTTKNREIGILLNGVEILSPTVFDENIFYGQIESVEVSNSGKDYDVVNSPSIEVIDIYGTGAKLRPTIIGNVKKVKIISPGVGYKEKPKISLIGGGGEGCVLESNLVSSRIFNDFSGRLNVNTIANTIEFFDRCLFFDNEEVIYNSNGNSDIGGIVSGSNYFIGLISEKIVKIYNTKSDSILKINEINLTTVSTGTHIIQSLKNKNTITEIYVKNSGQNYSNRSVTVPSQNSADNKTVGINTFDSYLFAKNHNFKESDIVNYSSTDTPISGLSTTAKYYITVVDPNKFRLSYAGIGQSLTDYYYKNKIYTTFSSLGIGTHIVSYPPIEIKIESVSIGSTAEIVPIFEPLVLGSISDVYIENPGVSYGCTDIINFHRRPYVGITSVKTQAIISPIIIDGVIVDVKIISRGSGYRKDSDIIVSGSGKYAEIVPNIDNNGKLSSVDILSGGIGYEYDSTNLILKNRGSQAQFLANLKEWKINQVVKSSALISSNDEGILYPSKNIDLELKFVNFYAPQKLRYQIGDNFTSNSLETNGALRHSPILGYAYDGNPIYGPYGYSTPYGGSIKLINSSYVLNRITDPGLRPQTKTSGYFIDDYEYDSSGDLDENNGRFCITPEYPDGVYAYFISISVDTSKRSFPRYPYVIGPTFKDSPVEENFIPKYNQDLDIFTTELTRNTSAYYTSYANSYYDLFEKVTDDLKQEFRVSEIDGYGLEPKFIISPGDNYKIGDRLILNRESTSGSPANIVVSQLNGRVVDNFSLIDYTIEDVNFIIQNYYKVIGKTSSPHELLDNQPINISGVSTVTSSILEGISFIKVENKSTNLSKDFDIDSVTGISTFIAVNNVDGFKPNSFIRINDEKLLITRISKENSTFYVNRLENTSSHNANDTIELLPTEFEIIPREEVKDITFENKVTFFDPKESVGTGTTGVTRYLPGIGVSSIEERFLPSRNIYIPNHNFKTGEKLIYDCGVGATTLIVRNVGSATSFRLQRNQTVYAVKFGIDFVGLSTIGFTSTSGIGTSLNSLEFLNIEDIFGSVGYSHSLTNTNLKITGTINQYSGIVTTRTNHTLIQGDVVNLEVIPKTLQTVKVIYDFVNRKVALNEISFTNSNVSTINDEIEVTEVNYNVQTGSKVVYISTNVIGGLENYGIYYVLKTKYNAIKLCETTLDLDSGNYINFTTSGGTNQKLYFIGLPLSVNFGNKLSFDLSDPSLFGMELEFYKDSEFNKKLEIIGTAEKGFAIRAEGIIGFSGAYLEIDTSNEYLPQTFYYNLVAKTTSDENKKQISPDDLGFLGRNKISIKNHPLATQYQINVIDDNTFSIIPNVKLNYLDKLNLTPSLFEYYTNSTNALGPIKNLKVNYGGIGYKKLPFVENIESEFGTNGVVKILSTSIGKIKSLERIKDGFDYPTDPTLSPSLTIPTVVGVKNIRTIDYVGIVTGGRGYNTNPTLLVKDSTNIKLSCGISGGSVTETKVDVNSTELGGPLEIIPIRNSNGHDIDAISVNTNLVTLELLNTNYITVGYGNTQLEYPFAVGDFIFIENCRLTNFTKGLSNFNSSSYDYSFFPVVGVSTANNTVTYDMTGISTGSFGTYDSSLNNGTVVNKKNMAVFEMILKDDVNYLSKEVVSSVNFSGRVMENGWNGNLNILRLTDCSGTLIVGDKVRGEVSKINGTVEFVQKFELNSTLGLLREKIGVIDNATGILNESQQKISDNFYYQKFAYSIKSEIPYTDWRESVRSTIHPSGFKEFSDLLVYSKPTYEEVKVGISKSTDLKAKLNTGGSKAFINIDNIVSMNLRNNFATVYEEDGLPDGTSSEDIFLYEGTPLLPFILNKSNKVVRVDDISDQFDGTSLQQLRGRFVDASDLLTLNSEFIQEEVVSFVEYNYPNIGLSTTYNRNTCKRDVGYIVDALLYDLKYNCNQKSVEAGIAYWNAGSSYIANEVEETLFAYNYIKFLAQYIINNQTPPTLYQTSVDQQFNLRIIQDPTNEDLYRYKDARNLILANRKEILDKSLASIAVGFSTFYFPGDVQINSSSRYYDAYRLIQRNRTDIINTSWSNTVGVYTGISTTQTKCKRDLGYFIDAVSIDIFTGGNSYSRDFVLQYFNNGTPISNGLVGEETQSIYAFTQARNLMRSAVSNQLAYKDYDVSVGPSTYSGGGGDITPNTNADTCLDVRNTISSLVGIITSVISSGSVIGLPSVNVGTYTTGGNKCYRDLGYIVDSIAEDVAFGTNQHIIYSTKKYFTGAGVALTTGLVGEESQSVYAFESAKNYINKALTNQLNVKDLSIIADPITGFNTSPASCSDVQNNVNSLVGILTTAILTGSLSLVPSENIGSTDCADVRTSIANYVGIITTIIGLGTDFAPILTLPSKTKGGIVVGLTTFKLKNNGTPLFKHSFDSSSSSVINLSNNSFIIPNHNYQTGQKLTYDYGLGTPIGIGTTTYVENNAGSIISSIGSPNGTSLYENGYSVAISTTVTGVSTVLSPVGPSAKIYNQVRGTNGVGISTFNVLISYSISTGQPLSTSIVLTDGGNNFAVGDTVSIAGTYIGGTSPTNNLTFVVSSTKPTKISSGANTTYSNISDLSGNAKFNISRDTDGYVSNISVANGGSGYAITSIVSIAGTSIGGNSSADNITFYPTILASNQLPQIGYVYKINDNEFRLSGLSTSLFLDLSNYGSGDHSLTYYNPNSSALITVDGIIQKPLTSKLLNVSLASSVSTASTTIISVSSGISSLISNDIININNEYLLVKSIGINSTNFVEVERGFFGSLSGIHTVGTSATILSGDFNIVGDTIYFASSPYGKVGPVGLETGSSFSGRVFSRSFDANQTKDGNIILDGISKSFTGIAATQFTLTSGGNTTQVLFNDVNSGTDSNNNPIILINNIFQVPEKDYIIDGSSQNTIKFISGTPKAGKITKVAITTGFGYQPLLPAAARATVSAAGTISSITLTGKGFGYRQSPTVSIASTIGFGASITSIVSAAGTVTGFNIVNPGSGYTTSAVPEVRIGIPTGYSHLGVAYTGGTSGNGQGLKVIISVGQGSSITSFAIDDPGRGYKPGDILYVPDLSINTGIGTTTFKEFRITVQETETDTFSGFYPGQFILFDSITSQFNGIRKKFTLKTSISGQSEVLTLKTPLGSDLDISNNLLIFINDVLQVPNSSYTLQGSRVFFKEAPKENSTCTILYYRGSSADVELVSPPQTVKSGDLLTIGGSDRTSNYLDQFDRSVKTIYSPDTIKTFPYDGPGITTSNTTYRPANYKIQMQDRIVNGERISKERSGLKSNIRPTANLIKPVTTSDTVIYVDNAFPLFSDVDTVTESLRDVILVEQKDLNPAVGLSSVSRASTISSVSIVDNGVGYAYTASPKVLFSESKIIRKDPIYDWNISYGIPTTYQLNSITYDSSFIAVGDQSALVTSADGEYWQNSTVGFGTTVNLQVIKSIGLGNSSLLIAAGSGAKIIKAIGYSNTISSWTQSSLYDDISVPGFGVIGRTQTYYNGTLKDIVYGAPYDTFVTVGTAGSIFVGSGITTDIFTNKFSQTLQDLNSVSFSSDSNYFIAVGNNGVILTSSIGQVWDSESSPTFYNLNKVLYQSGTFVIVGDNGVVITSTTRGQYTLISTNISVDLTNINYDEGVYVAIDSNGDLYYSFDLGFWVYRDSLQSNALKDLIQIPTVGVGGRYVFVGSSGTSIYSEPIYHRASGFGSVSNGIVTSVTITDGGFGYDALNPPPTIIEPDRFNQETLLSIKAKGDFGTIIGITTFVANTAGIGTTTPKIKFVLKSDQYDNSTLGIGYSSLNNFGVTYTQLEKGDYFVISNSNVSIGHPLVGITTLLGGMSNYPASKVGTAVSFIDGVYIVEDVTPPDGVGIVTVTCNFAPKSPTQNYVEVYSRGQFNTGVGTNYYYGRYSWSKIYDYQNRIIRNPQAFSVNVDNGIIGLSTSSKVIRTRGLLSN